MNTNKAEEIREDIIERTAKNIPTRVQEDYVKTQIRIALNNYAVPFEKEIDYLTKEVERLRSIVDSYETAKTMQKPLPPINH